MNLSNYLILETKKLKLPKFEVADHAPETLEALTRHYTSTGKLKIWSGASTGTVWGAAEHNWLFRAWHDFNHLILQTEFNRIGELKTCAAQMSQVESSFLHKVLHIEIVEQLNHFETIGAFPQNQLEFFKNKLQFYK